MMVPAPTPTGSAPGTIITPPVVGGGSTTTTVAPVNPPAVVCPGNGQACSPVDNGNGDNSGDDSDDSDSDSDDEEETPEPTGGVVVPPPSYTHGGARPTGTGVLPKPPMTTGHVPVTGGAARAGMALSGVVGVLGFAVVFL
jgi:hypothetical protein